MCTRENMGYVLNENHSFSTRYIDLYQKKEYDTRISLSTVRLQADWESGVARWVR